ncbi:MAG: hypothetical protein KKE02_15575 [Alphaproteobacteria bacterium]|nr:hypothetical protein [Alphaproteobacteria bacterium]MBU1512705.1 hypothetical protein [Alphaproteobacteria bacterium]MBU2096084.1 hypothetical protein [Alphaproteobacteria bacterium]MBU2152440.1 hypothetical protein [Alphaproteobacteria bacterium]MBU2308026.1 hypothetical protein [Alphaproteobacteria bacterium]
MKTILLAVIALLAAASAAQAQYAPEAVRVMERARAASGGKAWARVAGLHEIGTEGGFRYERWADPLRFGIRTDIGTPAGRVVRGYNGAGAWSLHPSSVNVAAEPQPDMGQARAEAYVAGYGYYFRSRFDARASYVGVRQAEGRSFEVVRAHPNGGEARELWFDRKTGLLGRIVAPGAKAPLTVEVSDHRRVGGVMVPFRFVTFGGGLAKPVERVLESVDFKPLDRAMFSLPRPK